MNNGLDDLYREIILDHNRNPRNYGSIQQDDVVSIEEYNPLCGDKIIVYLTSASGIVENIKFEGEGCSISQASASIMGDALARSGQWQGWSPTGMLGHRINGKRLGIVGMGRIGEAVARRARGFGLSVHYHNRKPVHPETEAELEATYWESLEQMLARVDIVSVNCPHTSATNHLLSRERLSLMQRSAYLVNTSRGEVVDEIALADLLAQRHIAGAGLDVYSSEPEIPAGLRELPNVVLLPHIGSATIEGRLQMGDKYHKMNILDGRRI